MALVDPAKAEVVGYPGRLPSVPHLAWALGMEAWPFDLSFKTFNLGNVPCRSNPIVQIAFMQDISLSELPPEFWDHLRWWLDRDTPPPAQASERPHYRLTHHLYDESSKKESDAFHPGPVDHDLWLNTYARPEVLALWQKAQRDRRRAG